MQNAHHKNHSPSFTHPCTSAQLTCAPMKNPENIPGATWGVLAGPMKGLPRKSAMLTTPGSH